METDLNPSAPAETVQAERLVVAAFDRACLQRLVGQGLSGPTPPDPAMPMFLVDAVTAAAALLAVGGASRIAGLGPLPPANYGPSGQAQANPR
jgi:hypothetical protein